MGVSNGPRPVPLAITREEYVARIASGESQASIARSLGVCQDTMTKWRRRWGLGPMRPPRQKGESATRYRWTDRTGYVLVPNDGTHGRSGARIAEHIVIAEAAAGRRLGPGEVVHHVNCQRDDNRAENLVICDRATHGRWHASLESLVAGLIERGMVAWTGDGYSIA